MRGKNCRFIRGEIRPVIGESLNQWLVKSTTGLSIDTFSDFQWFITNSWLVNLEISTEVLGDGCRCCWVYIEVGRPLETDHYKRATTLGWFTMMFKICIFSVRHGNPQTPQTLIGSCRDFWTIRWDDVCPRWLVTVNGWWLFVYSFKIQFLFIIIP